ncbi:MAG: ferritin-like domain-containing protein [Syntrophobacteraceae bacterium]
MAMTNIEIANELLFLVKLDLDAMQAYSRAIPTVCSACVKDLLRRFQQDHERHVEQLSAVIRALDAEPLLFGTEPSSFQTADSAAGLSLNGEGALNMIKVHEELVTRNYGSSCEMDFTPNIKELVSENYQDEQVHLRFIRGVLAGRAWGDK